MENALVDWYNETYGSMTKKQVEEAIQDEIAKYDKFVEEYPLAPHYQSSHIQNVQFYYKWLAAFV